VAANGIYGGNCATSDGRALGIGFTPLGAPGGCGITIDGTGRSNTGNNDRQILADFTANWDPSDKLSTWMNLDYMAPANDSRSGKPYAVGFAVAGRYELSDVMGIALRGEYIYSNDNYLGIQVPINLATIVPELVGGTPPGILNPTPGWYKEDQEVWSITATLDRALTEHLTLKAEVVYQQGSADRSDDTGLKNNQFFCNKNCNHSSLQSNQVLLGAQMTYEF